MMRYIFVPYIDQIPQWKQCFYDNKTLDQIQKFLIDASELYFSINIRVEQIRQKYPNVSDSEANIVLESRSLQANNNQSLQIVRIHLRKRQEVYQLISEWCMKFTKYSNRSAKIVGVFVKIKVLETKSKYQQYCKCLSVVRSERQNILMLLQNLYLQSFYLLRAIQFNYSSQVATTKKYEQFAQKFEQHKVKFSVNNRLRRFRILTEQFLEDIKLKYVLSNTETQQVSHQILEQMKQNLIQTNHIRHRILGVTMGTLIVFVLVVVMTDIYHKIQVEDNSTFNHHFPIWRGASYILLYLWILGIDILFYETSQINYRLIFQFKSHSMPQSRFTFFQASLLSVIYIVLFYIFTLKINGYIKTDFLHYGAVFWAILILEIIIVSPINMKKSKKGRFYLFKLLGRVILTPCVKSSFMIIWVTEQLSSFNQPFGDLFYTICYVASNDSNYCSTRSPFASTAYILTIFSYRIIQNLKMWHQNTMNKADHKYSFVDPPFIGSFRGLSAFITTLFALFDRLKLFEGTFTVWLVLSIITTLYSWFIDIRLDWGILSFGSRNCLRQKLLFPKAKGVYYFFAAFDLVLRAAWVLTISNLLFIDPGFPRLIFVMIISYLEIFRRGLWNILRIQNEHVRNCGQFRATADDSHILKAVRQKVKEKQQILKNQSDLLQRKLGKNSPKARLMKKASIQVTQIQKQIIFSQQLQKKRLQSNIQFFKQEIVHLRNTKTQINQQLQQGKDKLQQIKKFISQIR